MRAGCIYAPSSTCSAAAWSARQPAARSTDNLPSRPSAAHGQPDQQLIIHTDCGCQYTSWDFRREVAAHGTLQSMSRPGTPYDNTCAETFSRPSRSNAFHAPRPIWLLLSTFCSTTECASISLLAIPYLLTLNSLIA